MTPLQVAQLSDHLENVVMQSHSLLVRGINRLTPLGILYLLTESPFSEEVHTLTGLNIFLTQTQARTELHQNFPGFDDFAATEDVVDLINKTVEIAGGPNRSRIGHMILAMLSPDAQHTDAYQFLTRNGVTENQVKQNLEIRGSDPDRVTEQITTDYGVEFNAINQPTQESPYHEKLITRVLSLLNKRRLANVAIAGFPGVGRHTLVSMIAQKVTMGQFAPFKDFQMRKLNWSALKKHQQPDDAIAELSQQLQKVILVVDNLTSENLPLCIALLESKTPVILITTSAEEKKLSSQLVGKAITIQIDEPDPDVVTSILQLHMKQIALHYSLEGEHELNKQAVDMLTRLGPSISGLSLPGGAIDLLNLVVSHDELKGDRIIDAHDIALVIQLFTDIPAGALTQDMEQRFARVPSILDSRIIGQEKAKEAINAALLRARAGLRNPKKPIGVFIFLGPTGVGKTETVKALAEALFDNEDMIVRIDLSEYMEKHSVSRLIGAPPGYVAHEEGGQLTNAVQQRPFSVILFDESDKAHPDVFNILLQVLDDGRLTDGKGRTVDFRNTLIIFTSNHGSSMIIDQIQAGMSYEELSEDTIEWFKKQVRPEFFNRITEVIVFRPISPDDAEQILDLQINKLVIKPTRDRYSVEVELTEPVEKFLHEKGYSSEYGARPLERAIDTYINTPLSDILLGDLSGITTIRCDFDETTKQITFEKE